MKLRRCLYILLLSCVCIGLTHLKVSAVSPTYAVSPSYKSGPYYSALTNVALTGDQREDIVNVALSQVGYKEGSAEEDYSGADDGHYKNYSEYNDWYNKNVSVGMPVGGEGAPWCATFVSWCAEQAGISADILRRSVRASLSVDGFNINFYSGSDTLNRTADDNAYFKGYNYTPQRGDLFFSRKWTHVGIVVGVDGPNVITVEGNTNDDDSDEGCGVYLRTTRKIEDLYFGVPEYAAYEVTAAPESPKAVSDKTAYGYGETVNISWNMVSGAASYAIDVWNGETHLLSKNVGATLSWSFAPNAIGDCHIYVTAANDLGAAVSEPLKISVKVAPKEVSGVHRLAGADRYETAFLAADELKKLQGAEKFFSIIVASGEEFADALAGSYLAAVKNAPILLVKDREQEMGAVKDYIRKNLALGGTVYLLGGEKAVPKRMESGLAGFQVKRLGGNTRFDTNAAILQEAGVTRDQEILVVTGHSFADSLSASATGLPVLLVNTQNNKLTPGQKELLAAMPGCRLTIVGGATAVGSGLEKTLKDFGTVDRLAGENRYHTCTMVARRYFADPDFAVLAYGKNFPDGLSGGPVAKAMGAPLILTQSGKEKTAAEYMTETGIHSGYILGGTAVLSENTVNNVFGKG